MMANICSDINTIISFYVSNCRNIVLTMPHIEFLSNQSLFFANNCTNLWHNFTLLQLVRI